MLNTVPQITADEVKSAIDNKEDAILLDVRTQGEYARGRISGSINVPMDSLNGSISVVIPDRNKKVFVYCLSGSRSDIAAKMLLDGGYANVFSMTHGLLQWRAKKFSLTE